ncbi:raffinose/stachyose/melibiose transport system permease protein/N-acetylglucosamine transport system permease protein [Scopulibacillus darangshiensis]|uniref:Raffinose/stachyose/melibiose transport system permease protein/N-acetylglucosamine transport system permease protein n=1 Tax=Scopulibacillus darangshiensis TaxID=442528 RepID=A0A4R2NKU0_9BACL|nr:carbohydrate ABC transporter permease [Scopulibacillus darangshiensis]TCP21875.1 raffinose/stachyose/melibiose transport system permease protein/N-acetylglucosamine transport system permease protein [Scopulibacillus darangshiensis]
MKEKHTFIDIIWRIILYLWGITILFPLVWVLYEALKTNQEFFKDIWKLPETLQWVNFKNAWTEYNFGGSLLNTLYYVGGSMVIGLFFTTINAYALTRLQFRGRKLIWGLIMMSLFLPGINALVPQYVLMRDLHLTNSLTGLILLSSLGESVFYLLLLSGFMKSIPKELEESAMIDGASLFKIFFKIIVPLATPGIVTVAIFKFIGFYNNFLGPFIYLSDPSKYTIAVQMYEANKLMQYSADWVTLFAGVMIAMVPSVIIFILFQRSIIEGATLGGIKN